MPNFKVLCSLAFIVGMAAPSYGDDAVIDRFVDAMMGDFHAGQRDEIASYCASHWPTDFVMQEHCLHEHNEARLLAQQFDTMNHPAGFEIWGHCGLLAKDAENRTDWVLMEHCIAGQSAAFERLQANR